MAGGNLQLLQLLPMRAKIIVMRLKRSSTRHRPTQTTWWQGFFIGQLFSFIYKA